MIEHPDIAIIGVPKAGTTSLHRWLANFPDVSAANPKESFYFMDHGNSMVNPKGSYLRSDGVAYDSFFNSPSAANQLALDSTTHHFFQQTAIDQFSQNGTKVCVVLREPVSRLVSYYNYVGFARSGFTQPIDFSLFVEKLFDGDFQSLRQCFVDEREYFSLRTSLDQGDYQKYLKRWMDKIPHNKLKVLFFEDLVSNRSSFLEELATFFEISHNSSDLENFQVQNEGRSVKFPVLNRIVRSASHYVSSLPFYETLKRQYASLQQGEKLTFDWQQHSAAIERLYQHYCPLNEQLAELIPFDVRRWAPNNVPLDKKVN